MSHNILQFTLTSTTLAESLAGIDIPVTLTLTSTVGTRKIEISTDNRLSWITQNVINSPTSIVAVIAYPITDIRFTGSIGDMATIVNSNIADGTSLAGIVPSLIYKSGIASSSTGTTSLVTLGSITIPGGILLPNSQIKISALFSTTGTVGNKTYGITFGGQGIYDQSYAGAQATGIDRRVACRNSLSSQVVVAGWVESQSGSHTAGASYLTVDTTSDVIINFNGTLTTSSETIKLESYLVEVIL